MTTLAITGHRGLPADIEQRVDALLRDELSRSPHVTGVSCIADGADSLFARAVLDQGGELVVIVPAAQYRDGLPAEHHPLYDALLDRASEVVELDYEEATPESYMDASLVMLDRADHLIAVWDGEPARGYGGTADVVQVAQARGLLVTVVWPEGARRD